MKINRRFWIILVVGFSFLIIGTLWMYLPHDTIGQPVGDHLPVHIERNLSGRKIMIESEDIDPKTHQLILKGRVIGNIQNIDCVVRGSDGVVEHVVMLCYMQPAGVEYPFNGIMMYLRPKANELTYCFRELNPGGGEIKNQVEFTLPNLGEPHPITTTNRVVNTSEYRIAVDKFESWDKSVATPSNTWLDYLKDPELLFKRDPVMNISNQSLIFYSYTVPPPIKNTKEWKLDSLKVVDQFGDNVEMPLNSDSSVIGVPCEHQDGPLRLIFKLTQQVVISPPELVNFQFPPKGKIVSVNKTYTMPQGSVTIMGLYGEDTYDRLTHIDLGRNNGGLIVKSSGLVNVAIQVIPPAPDQSYILNSDVDSKPYSVFLLSLGQKLTVRIVAKIASKEVEVDTSPD